MLPNEKNLYFWGGLSVLTSGLLWIIPGINSLLSIAGIIGLILIIARLGLIRGIWFGVMGIIMAMITCSTLLGIEAAVLSTAGFSLSVIAPGLLMGQASRTNLEPSKVIIRGLVPFMLLFLLFLSQYSDFYSHLPVFLEQLNSDISASVGASSFLSQMIANYYPPADGSLDRFLTNFNNSMFIFVKIFPGMLFIAFLGLVLFGYTIAGAIAVRMKIIIPRFQPFYKWKANGWWLLPTIAGLIPVAMMNYDLWFYVGVNILIISGHVYMVVGLAIVEAFFKRFDVQMPIRVIFYIFLILGNFVTMGMLAVLGLLDSKFNFARESIEKENKN
jgi:uncharacterized protein YybS (DUF2232 family)